MKDPKVLKVLKVEKEFVYDQIGSWKSGNPFTIAFVYPQHGEPCIVKGGLKDVEKYIDNKYPVAIIHYQFFCKRDKKRGVYYRVNGAKEGITIYFNKSKRPYRATAWSKEEKGRRCQVVVYNRMSRLSPPLFEKEVRRLPRCWMKELNPYVG